MNIPPVLAPAGALSPLPVVDVRNVGSHQPGWALSTRSGNRALAISAVFPLFRSATVTFVTPLLWNHSAFRVVQLQ
eukprot:688073-Prymnesium_polylepis.1